MNTSLQPDEGTSSKKRTTSKRILIASLGGYLLLAACSATFSHFTLMQPPRIEGSTFAGIQSCIECHEDIVSNFEGATHSKLMAHNSSVEMGCEACHGPGSIHNDSGGEIGTIHNPSNDPETCTQCHVDVAGSFRLPHAHSVHDGDVTCNSCHDPHNASAIMGGGTALAKESETCIQCHQAQAGPFVFEHEATRDGCTSCHVPHGSVNDKMLRTGNATLCLQCHAQHQTVDGQILIGGRNHTYFLPRGNCWTAGCHEAVHGSHIGSSMRF